MNQSDLSILEREKIGIVLTYQKKKKKPNTQSFVCSIYSVGAFIVLVVHAVLKVSHMHLLLWTQTL